MRCSTPMATSHLTGGAPTALAGLDSTEEGLVDLYVAG